MKLINKRNASIGLVLLLIFALIGCSGKITSAPPSNNSTDTPKSTTEETFNAEEYFSGKTITLSINQAVGGGADGSGRVFADYLSEALPGNPEVIVENREGAGGVTGANYFYQTAKPDGLTILLSAAAVGQQLFPEESGAEFDLKNMIHLAGIGEAVMVYGSSKKMKGIDDLFDKNKNFFVAIRSATTSSSINMLVPLNAIGSNIKTVQYGGGGGEPRAAVFRGEADIFADAAMSWHKSILSEVENGTVVPLFQGGILKDGEVARDPRLADYPTFLEYYTERGEELSEENLQLLKVAATITTIQRLFSIPKDTPSEIVEVLEKAFVEVMNNPEWQKDEEVNGAPINTFNGDEINEMIEQVLSTPKPLLDTYLEIIDKN